jgi:signal transduction histidine kinase
MLRLRQTGLRLRGNARNLEDGLILLELSPAIVSEEEFARVGLRYEDLAFSDNTLDLMISLRAHRQALNQAKEISAELDSKNKALALAQQELVGMLEQERLSTQFRNRVLAMLSHEFRTALAQILSVGEILRRGIKIDNREAILKHGNTLANSASQIAETFDSLGNYARTESIEGHHFERLHLESLISEAIERMPKGEVSRIVSRKPQTQRDSDNPVIVETSRSLFLLALSNLLNNAVKYSAPESDIIVEYETCEGEVAIRVSDQGIGIPPQTQVDIFQAYVRGDNVAKRRGTGLGLAVVALCLNSLGAQIHLRSGVGEGSTFTITMPLVPRSEVACDGGGSELLKDGVDPA